MEGRLATDAVSTREPRSGLPTGAGSAGRDHPRRRRAGSRRSACAGSREELGVAPMALYRHVANKDDLIDAMVDVVFSEIELPSAGPDWKTAMRRRAISVRDALCAIAGRSA